MWRVDVALHTQKKPTPATHNTRDTRATHTQTQARHLLRVDQRAGGRGLPRVWAARGRQGRRQLSLCRRQVGWPASAKQGPDPRASHARFAAAQRARCLSHNPPVSHSLARLLIPSPTPPHLTTTQTTTTPSHTHNPPHRQVLPAGQRAHPRHEPLCRQGHRLFAHDRAPQLWRAVSRCVCARGACCAACCAACRVLCCVVVVCAFCHACLRSLRRLI